MTSVLLAHQNKDLTVSKPTESGQDQTCIYLKNRAWAIEPTMAVRDPHGHIRELELETLSHMTKSVSKEWKYAVKYSDPNLKSPLRNEVLAVQKCQTLKIGTSQNLFRFEALFFISVYN